MNLTKMTHDEYDGLPGIRWSVLRAMRTSPRHYLHATLEERVDTAAFRLGRALHAALLEPEHFVEAWVAYGETKQRRGKVWEQFKDEHAGKEILTVEEYEKAIAMSAAVRNPAVNARAAELFTAENTLREVAATWRDDATGLECKAMLDYLNPHTMTKVEVKTTRNIEPRWFGHDAARYGYHCQDAFHTRGAILGGNLRVSRHLIVAVENEPPFDVVVHEVPPEVIEAGDREVTKLLVRVKDCLARTNTGHPQPWPGVACDEVVPLVLPPWALGGDEPAELTLGGSKVSV